MVGPGVLARLVVGGEDGFGCLVVVRGVRWDTRLMECMLMSIYDDVEGGACE